MPEGKPNFGQMVISYEHLKVLMSELKTLSPHLANQTQYLILEIQRALDWHETDEQFTLEIKCL